jgi:hypothetical protein
MLSVLDPLNDASDRQRVIERLTVIACRVAVLATALHQLCTPSPTQIVLRVLRTRHLGRMFTIRQRFLHLFVATNAFNHVQLVARVVLSVE